MALSGLAFASLRYGPRTMIAKLNPEKLTKLNEIEARKGWIQKSLVFIFEAALSGLVGWRVGYSKISSQNENSYDEIANIPLFGGIAEGYVVAQTACSDKEYVEGLEMKVVALIYVIASLIIISFISGFNPNIISKSFFVYLPKTVS